MVDCNVACEWLILTVGAALVKALVIAAAAVVSFAAFKLPHWFIPFDTEW